MSVDKFRALLDGVNKHFDNYGSDEALETDISNENFDNVVDDQLDLIKNNLTKILDQENRILKKEHDQEEHIKDFEKKIGKFTSAVERVEKTEQELKIDLIKKINKFDNREDISLIKKDIDIVKNKLSDAIGLENRYASEMKNNFDHLEFSLAEEYSDKKEQFDDNKDDLRKIKGGLSELNSRFNGVEFVTRKEMKDRMRVYDDIKREIQLNRREIILIEQDIRQMTRLLEKVKKDESVDPEKIKSYENKISALKGKALILKEQKEKPVVESRVKMPLSKKEKKLLNKAKFDKLELPGPMMELEYHPESKEHHYSLVDKFLRWVKGY